MSLQYSDEDDAVPPPISFSSSGYASRNSKSQRPSTDRIRSIRRAKTPNDVPVKPASEHIMNDLLSSFSAITPTTDSFPTSTIDADNYARPQTPLRASRPSSRNSNRNYRPTDFKSSRHASIRRAPDATRDFVEVSHPIEDPTELAPEEDAAEPPVVRTSRPPSGLTRTSAKRAEVPSRSRSRKISSPRAMISPPPERATPHREIPRQVISPKNGSQMPQNYGSARPSTEIRGGWSAAAPSTPTSATKGKSRDVYTPRTSSLRSTAYENQRAGHFFSSTSTARGSAAPSARGSMDTDRPMGVAGPAYPRGSSRQQAFAESDEQTYRETGDGRIVPTRRSSLHGSPTTSTTNSEKKRSKSSTPSSPELARKQIVTDQTIPEGSLLPPKRIAMEEDSDDNEVSRRIKQLKAQREIRRNSIEQVSTIGIPSTKQMNGLSAQPSLQLREAPPVVEEHRISDEVERQKDNYTLDVPPTTIAESRPLKQSSRDASKTRTGPSSFSFTSRTPKLSYETPRHSRQNSQSKRWSPLAFAGKAESTRKADFDRSASPMLFRGASMDIRRTSVDSVRASVKEFLSAPRLTQKIEIPGEYRKVAFSEVGDPKGHVVLCCVGMGLTRYIMAFYDELATSLGLRLITPERPGIGESDAYADGPRTPMSWPDDVQAICDHLRITKFSLLAHSAGAVYALATALRLPQYLRGKIHLLAPWIPPSQLVQDTQNVNRSATPAGVLPRSQRFLRILPSSFLKLSNSSFTSFGSRSGSPKPSKYGRNRRSTESARSAPKIADDAPALPPLPLSYSSTNLATQNISLTQPPSPHLDSFRHVPHVQQSIAQAVATAGNQSDYLEAADAKKQRQRAFDETLTPMIWDLATSNANPSVDLLICLERHRTIGFSYIDVGAKPATKTIGERPGRVIDLGTDVDGNQWPEMGVIIHHGSKDTRVPVENVRWLGQRMLKCEVKILDGLGHGLMGEAGVMGEVLAEIGKEWDTNGGFRKRRGGR